MLLSNYPIHRARRVLGLISGTSADGIDVALCRIAAEGSEEPFEVEKFVSVAYPTSIKEQIMQAAADRLTLRQTAVLGTRLGQLFGEAALELMPSDGCDLVASHGQTVCHLPEHGTTLQIAEGAMIAARTGTVTVSDFRTADMAWGGQGAPLVPVFDAHILAHPDLVRVAINLGGIANLTVIPPHGPVTAWDSGPANGVSDALCRLRQVGDYDVGGEVAASGQVDEQLLEDLFAQEPYFGRRAPKSTGLELFGEDFARRLLDRGSTPDLIRTALALSARSLVEDLRGVALEHPGRELELVFAGGGTSNPVLMGEIQSRLERAGLAIRSRSFAEFGIPEAGREAAAFAFLGDLAARGLPGAAPGATGASRAAILGKFSFPASLAKV